jgi:hypothetical protein
VSHIGRHDEDTTWADREDAVVPLQLARTGNDVLRLLGLIGVPAEATTRLDLEDDRRRRFSTVSSIEDKGSMLTNRVVSIAVELDTWQIKRRHWVHTIPSTFATDDVAEPARQATRRAPRQASCSGRWLAYT